VAAAGAVLAKEAARLSHDQKTAHLPKLDCNSEDFTPLCIFANECCKTAER
jgi:hypothetical protein